MTNHEHSVIHQVNSYPHLFHNVFNLEGYLRHGLADFGVSNSLISIVCDYVDCGDRILHERQESEEEEQEEESSSSSEEEEQEPEEEETEETETDKDIENEQEFQQAVKDEVEEQELEQENGTMQDDVPSDVDMDE